MAYKTLPKGMDFSTTFETYIIAYCPDLCEWFVTNKRFFYYEYEKEFQTEQEGIDYFKSNVKKFYEIEKELSEYRPSFLDHKIFLSNYDEIIEVDRAG